MKPLNTSPPSHGTALSDPLCGATVDGRNPCRTTVQKPWKDDSPVIANKRYGFNHGFISWWEQNSQPSTVRAHSDGFSRYFAGWHEALGDLAMFHDPLRKCAEEPRIGQGYVSRGSRGSILQGKGGFSEHYVLVSGGQYRKSTAWQANLDDKVSQTLRKRVRGQPMQSSCLSMSECVAVNLRKLYHSHYSARSTMP